LETVGLDPHAEDELQPEWISVKSAEESQDEYEDALSEIQTLPKDTQAIFREETPPIDFAIATPDGGWTDSTQPSSPLHDLVSFEHLEDDEAETGKLDGSLPTEEDLNSMLDAWIDSHLEEGTSFDDVVAALKATGMDADVADAVLEYMKIDGTLPQMRGVWTEEDDACVQAADARGILRMIEKHGQDGYDSRFIFLENYDRC
jgi:hypothetical protein